MRKKKKKSLVVENKDKVVFMDEIMDLKKKVKELEREKAYLIEVLERKELLINSLKSEKSKSVQANQDNKRKWLYGFYGEDEVD